jgi:hypothetical protein
MSFLMLLLLVLAPANDPAPPPAPLDPGEDLLTRVHDLQGLLPDGASAMTPLSPLPLMEGDMAEGWERHGEMFAEALYSLLVDVLHEDELQYEHRRVDLLDGPRLHITAPEQVHRTVDELSAYLRAASRRAAVLRVTQFAVPKGVLDADGLSSTDVAALVASGQLVATHERRVELLLGVPWSESSDVITPMIQSWDVQIAQQVATHEPGIRAVPASSTLCLMVSPHLNGGFMVRVAGRLDRMRDPLVRSIEPMAWSVGDGGVRDLSHDGRLELHRIGTGTLVGSANLAPGDELILGASTHTGTTPSSVVMAVQLESVDPLPAAPVLSQGALRLVDLSAHTSRGGHAHALRSRWLGGRPYRFHVEGMRNTDIEGANFWFPNEGVDHGDVLEGAWEALEWDDGSVWDDGPWALVWGQDSAVGQVMRGLTSRLVAARGMSLEWSLEDESGHAVAAGVLNTAGDADALAVVGEAFGAVSGTEPEVASGAVAQEPRVVDLFDGLWLRARPAGTRELDVTLARNASFSRELASLGPSWEGMFDRASFHASDVARRVAVDGRRHELAQVGPPERRLGLWIRASYR